LPHGIFELPAVLFSIGIGLKLGMSVVGGRWSVKKGKGSVGYVFREGVRFLFLLFFLCWLWLGLLRGF